MWTLKECFISTGCLDLRDIDVLIKFLRVDVFLFLCSFRIFLVWPEIDYAVSAIAFDPQTGFVFSELLFVRFLYSCLR